jgi:hypothetical protein
MTSESSIAFYVGGWVGDWLLGHAAARKLRWGNAKVLISKAASQGPTLLPSANIVGVFDQAEIVLSAFPDLRTYTIEEVRPSLPAWIFLLFKLALQIVRHVP